MKRRIAAVFVFALLHFVLSPLRADDPIKEDLSACKLPHGTMVIPTQNTPEGQKGYILRISDTTLNPSPLKRGEEPKSADDFLNRIVAAKAGDICYYSLNDGTLAVISRRGAELGKKFLYQCSGTTFPRPPKVASKEERTGGKPVPGLIDRIQDGHCYLIETHDGKYALIRIIQKQKQRVLVQFVYQPNGRCVFTVPKGTCDDPKSPTPLEPKVAANMALSLQSKNAKERQNALFLLTRQYSVVRSDSLKALEAAIAQHRNDRGYKSPLHTAISAVRTYRIFEAEALLPSVVDYEIDGRTLPKGIGVSGEFFFPAASTLVTLRTNPKKLVSAIAAAKNKRQLELLTWVLFKRAGSVKNAITLLNDPKTRSYYTDERGRENLTNAVKRLKTTLEKNLLPPLNRSQTPAAQPTKVGV